MDEVLSLAASIGYDGVEVRSQCYHKHEVELTSSQSQRKEIQQKSKDSEIDICAVVTSCKYADPSTVKKNIELTLRFIDLATDIGCKKVRVFGGEIPVNLTRRNAIDLLVSSLSSLAEYAEVRDVIVCVETHDDWSDPNDVAEVLKKVHHPAIGTNWDIMHPVRYGACGMKDAYETLATWIKHVYIHDGKFGKGHELTLVPIGQGQVDHKVDISLLNETSYDGFVSGEWSDWESYKDHLPRKLAKIKGYERERN